MPIFHGLESTCSPSQSLSTESRKDTDYRKNAEWGNDQSDGRLQDEVSPQNSPIVQYRCSAPTFQSREELIRTIKQRETLNFDGEEEGETEDEHLQHTVSGLHDWSLMSNSNIESPSGKDGAGAQQDVAAFNEPSELAKPSEIERPRSALHSGDFREGAAPSQNIEFTSFTGFNTSSPTRASKRYGSSPTTPWFNHSTHVRHLPREADSRTSTGIHFRTVHGTRIRAPSLGSFHANYILKPPTSPLVHQANNTDLDFSSKHEFESSFTPNAKSNRRRTLPPETFMQLRGSPPTPSSISALSRSYATDNGNEALRLQAYQPHRAPSLTLQPASSSPQTPFRLRRPSFASDTSPRIHASMVGSYEESILRGRMSTTPSQPLDFTAQIGVLGKGKCKSMLRCPPHITVPFPAVFYSYPTSGAGRSISDDSPSPYVGLIDLQNAIPRDIPSEKKRARMTSNSDNSGSSTPVTSRDESQRRKREKRTNRSDASKAPPGGSYRIPQRGQLQIIIKNPNKTAVKLFLVPYDLDDMEPGTKTFIRQRSYSAGPIIDMPLTARKNFGTDRPEASLNPTCDPKDKPTLRYLIHLNICCPNRGRFYLYSTIRVVFANRVPDGKEKLRNEIQYPEPRYGPYKPVRDSNFASGHVSGSDQSHQRRLIAGLGLNGKRLFDDKFCFPSSNGELQSASQELVTVEARSSLFTDNFEWQADSPSRRRHASDEMALDSPPSVRFTNTRGSHDDDTEMSDSNELYEKLHQLASTPTGSSSIGESLLAQRLREWSCSSEQDRSPSSQE